ncbi:MAG TPA: peptidylprolyl isomerase [Candidatus Angelobacter sp.]|jgi:cyclophilin family peptidyl-prolyl cis-trans isomerase|nr:peptidylprolyl isomerase [Candidatus Angelobacter sp.]
MSQPARPVWQMVATLGILAVGILAFTVYVGRSVGSTAGTAPTPTPTASSVRKTYSAPPPMTINTAHHYLVTMQTNKGTITLRLDPKLAPATVNNFVFLVNDHFYDGLKFHRVEANFVIQGGDPKGDGSGGPGYKFNDEPVKGEYTAGAVAMANSGANTNGSQFFICTVDDSKKLQKLYNLFGYVASGMDVVLKIAVGDVMTSVTVQEESS